MRSALLHITLTFLLLVKAAALPAQDQRKIDSLQAVLQSEAADTIKLRTLLALSQRYQGFDTEKAMSYGQQALMLAQTSNDKAGAGLAHNNLGDLFWYKSDYAVSFDHYLKALKIFEKLNKKTELADCYRNVGWIYFKQNDTESALKYYYKALNVNLQLKRKVQMALNYNDIGIVHNSAGRFEESLENYEKSLALQQELGQKQGMAASYGNMAIVYATQGKMDLAVKNMERSFELSKQTGSKQHLGISMLNLGSFYAKAGLREKAIVTIEDALRLAKEMGFKELMKDCYENLARAYAGAGNYEQALKYEQQLINLKDSIYNGKNSEQINEMTAKYDSEKKELMISSLEKENEIEAEKIRREKNFKISLLIFCCLLGIFAVILIRSNLNKKKANQQLSLAYREIELKNKDITDSINYSKRIQDASLPSRELKYKLFPDAFVLFRPKDIVSGDFYWFAEKNGRKLIAACDCTGHGVPGALMSMIGNNILNQVVVEEESGSASSILNRLQEEIRKALKQQEQTDNKDGMDIALVVIHPEGAIEFSGAQRPLWLLSKGALTEIKGDKFPVGGMLPGAGHLFRDHKIAVSKGDAFYISSDGIADQFGGPEGKKFMSRRLKELLTANSDKPMAEQEKIVEKAFDEWKGGYEQVDDVLMIGVRIL